MNGDLFVLHKWTKQMVHIIFGHPLTAKIICSHQKLYQLQYSWKLCFIISPPLRCLDHYTGLGPDGRDLHPVTHAPPWVHHRVHCLLPGHYSSPIKFLCETSNVLDVKLWRFFSCQVLFSKEGRELVDIQHTMYKSLTCENMLDQRECSSS